VAKKGMLFLAKNAKQPLLPIMVSGNPAITFSKTWDKTMVPLPFSKVTVIYRKPWMVPEDISENDMELLRQQVEDTLNDMRIQADEDTGYQGEHRGNRREITFKKTLNASGNYGYKSRTNFGRPDVPQTNIFSKNKIIPE
jgi:1-acyl-sn-glycerol-3-phosphate acyltransferase